jgi:hypothetical protein
MPEQGIRRLQIAAATPEALQAKIVRHTLAADSREPLFQCLPVTLHITDMNSKDIALQGAATQFAGMPRHTDHLNSRVVHRAPVGHRITWNVYGKPLLGYGLPVLQTSETDLPAGYTGMPCQAVCNPGSILLPLADLYPDMFALAVRLEQGNFTDLKIFREAA